MSPSSAPPSRPRSAAVVWRSRKGLSRASTSRARISGTAFWRGSWRPPSLRGSEYVEIEAKFSVDDAATLARMEEVPELAGFEIDAGVRRRDKDTFLDTADRRFLAAGYYLRRRETGDGMRLTLK